MIRLICIAAITALAACAATPPPRTNPLTVEQAQTFKVASVEVDASTADFASERAKTKSASLAADLQRRLEAAFADRLAETGLSMKVEVTQLNVVSSGASAIGSDKSRLGGFMRLFDGSSETPLAEYRIDVSTGTQAQSLLAFAITAAVESSDQFYIDLLQNFSEVAKKQSTE